jgi:hypothetical protein
MGFLNPKPKLVENKDWGQEQFCTSVYEDNRTVAGQQLRDRWQNICRPAAARTRMG